MLSVNFVSEFVELVFLEGNQKGTIHVTEYHQHDFSKTLLDLKHFHRRCWMLPLCFISSIKVLSEYPHLVLSYNSREEVTPLGCYLHLWVSGGGRSSPRTQNLHLLCW